MNKNLKELLRTYSLPMSVAPFILALACGIKTPMAFGILDAGFFINAIISLWVVMSFLFACVCFELGVQYCLSMGVPLMGCGNLDDSVAVLIMVRGCAVFIIAMKSKLLILCQEGREYQINDTIPVIVLNLLATKVFGGF